MSHRKTKLPSPPTRAHVYLLYIWGCKRKQKSTRFSSSHVPSCVFSLVCNEKTLAEPGASVFVFTTEILLLISYRLQWFQFRFEAEERLVSENGVIEASPGWKKQHHPVHGTREVQKTNTHLGPLNFFVHVSPSTVTTEKKKKNCTMIKKKQMGSYMKHKKTPQKTELHLIECIHQSPTKSSSNPSISFNVILQITN